MHSSSAVALNKAQPAIEFRVSFLTHPENISHHSFINVIFNFKANTSETAFQQTSRYSTALTHDLYCFTFKASKSI